jgi:hypothetical protein
MQLHIIALVAQALVQFQNSSESCCWWVVLVVIGEDRIKLRVGGRSPGSSSSGRTGRGGTQCKTADVVSSPRPPKQTTKQ